MVRLVRQVGRGVRSLLHRRTAEHDVDDEIAEFYAASVAHHRASGLSARDAERAARRGLGSAAAVREQVRASGWEHAVENLAQDIRYAVRGLRNAPVFTVTAVLTLALGLGASTAVFSAISPIMIEPLPFPDASRLVAISARSSTGGAVPSTLGSFDELQARSHRFARLAASDRWQPALLDRGEPEPLVGQRVTAGYFSVFGVAPFLGQDFTPADDRAGAPRVAILSGRFWQRRFGSDRTIVGRTIVLDGRPFLVIGILSTGDANGISPGADVWTPLQEVATGDFNTRMWGHHYQIVGRLAPEINAHVANAELAAIARDSIAAFPRAPWADMNPPLLATPLQREMTASVRPAMFAVAGAVILLLLIASVNVTNLLLARGARRETELAMRIALGAGRRRLVRQMLTESIVLALAGGALGFGVAHAGLRALLVHLPLDLPRTDAIHLDLRAFLFALALTGLIGVVVGVAPAFRALRADVTDGIRPGSRRTTVGRDPARTTLVVVEMALALILVVGTGLLWRSVRRLVTVPPGFDTSHLLTMQVLTSGGEFTSDTSRLVLLRQSLDAVRHLPGVTSAGWTSQLPLSGDVDRYGSEWQSLPSTRQGLGGDLLRYAVSPDYLAAMHIPLRAGRWIGANDARGGVRSVLINQSLAHRLFGARDPLGERVRVGPEMSDTVPWGVVVGVVGDVKQSLLDPGAPDAFYVAQSQWSWVDNVTSLVVRTRGAPALMAPAVKRAIWSVDAEVPVQRVETMDAFVAASAGQRRFVLLAIEVFAITALVLATIGLYGVMAGSVTERIREIGIRTALGATPAAVVGEVLRHALTVTLAGGVIGVVGALAASRLLASLLFGVSRADPLSYVVGLTVLTIAAIAAAWAPARQAARVDPIIALRAE